MKRLLLVALLLSACAKSESGITGDDLARQIADDVGHPASRMTCESINDIKAGAVSDCISDSGLTSWRVTFQDKTHFSVATTTR